MIDLETAKRMVAEQWLQVVESRLGTAAAVVDKKTIEYEWGWMICMGPLDRRAVRWEERRRSKHHDTCVLVDRETGRQRQVSSSGPRLCIMSLLSERPSGTSNQYVRIEPEGPLEKINVFWRALQPIRPSYPTDQNPDEPAFTVFRKAKPDPAE